MESYKMLADWSKRAAGLRQEAHEIARELIRTHGGKMAAALDAVARDTGLTPRRVRSHHLGEPITVAAHEIEALRMALLTAMEREERRAAHRAAIWRAKLGISQAGMASSHGAVLVCGAADGA
jgi:predicted DNA-binding protein (UPF0251 family)